MKPKAIFFLDAGRKFFGVPAIKKLLTSVKEAGLDSMQLYFSDNQGFRFALDDRTVRTAYGTYDLTPALGDGYSQEDKAPDGTGKYWRQKDMEEICAYAAGLGVELIPALNMPGHMGAILERFPHLRYPGSRGSIDLRDPEATAFALALADKYASYFASQGCRFFNFGADEFANDLGAMGFDVIYRDGTMKHFVAFVNRLVEIITGCGMTPMAFNDGIYYNDDLTTYGRIDNRLWVQYWIAGWNGYSPASAETLQRACFPLVNACHKFYCGTGVKDWAERRALLETFDPHIFDRDSYIAQPAAGMLCCWCDRANLFGPDEGAAFAELLPPVLDAFGRAMGNHA